MTLAELNRLVESKKRMQRLEARERATFDYKLADLIGRSIARIYSSSSHMPTIDEAYPSLFSREEIEEAKQKQKNEQAIATFKQFALIHNAKFKEVGKTNE